MTKQDAVQVAATNNMFAETMRYFQHLPPRKQRIAERLDKWSGEAMDVFWPKEKEDGDAQIV